MAGLNQFLAANGPTILLFLVVAIFALAAVVFRLSAAARKNQETWKQLLSDTTTGNLELILQNHLRERMELQGQLEDALSRIEALEHKAATSKRHVGLVRYDAYSDVGGSQSFALAVYDDHGNGAVISSLVGRMDCRVYCKPLVAGRSDRSLTAEEIRAMQDASADSPKVVVGF